MAGGGRVGTSDCLEAPWPRATRRTGPNPAGSNRRGRRQARLQEAGEAYSRGETLSRQAHLAVLTDNLDGVGLVLHLRERGKIGLRPCGLRGAAIGGPTRLG